MREDINRQAVGFMAAMLLWRGYKDDKVARALLDGAYLLSEALGVGQEELKEALRIYNKYKHHLYSRVVWQNLTYRETFETAVEFVEEELGEEIKLIRGSEKWSV